MCVHVARWGGRVHSTDGAAPGISIVWGGHPGVVGHRLPSAARRTDAGRWPGWVSRRAGALGLRRLASLGCAGARAGQAGRCWAAWAAAAAAARASAPEADWRRLLSRTGSPGGRTCWGCAGVRAGWTRRPVFLAASTILGRAESAAAAARPVPLQGGPSTPPSGMNPARFGRPASLAAARPVPLDGLVRAFDPAGPDVQCSQPAVRYWGELSPRRPPFVLCLCRAGHRRRCRA